MTLTVGSLFSGIGGLDLGLERAGMKVIWQCEIDPYASRVLKKHWPDVPNIGDIKEVIWDDIERPDVICGGYPCQPFSQAGPRSGEDDPRHLFPWVAKAIRHLRPRYAILENVSGHLSLGFGTVQGLLAEIGYDSRWDCIPAASVGAPHLRDRVFIIATPRTEQRRIMADGHDPGSCDALFAGWDAPWNGGPFMANTGNDRAWRRIGGKKENQGDSDREEHQSRGDVLHDRREWWPPEPGMGRVAYGIPDRMDRLKGLGNAVVPQVAEYIGRMIINAEET